MFNWFKKYFIPHEHNDHKPHILRLKSSLFILSVVLLVELIFLTQVLILFPRVGFFASILESALIKETNINRLENKISSLKENPLLDKAAQAKAEDMVLKGYFSHISPLGVDPWYWIKKVGYEYSYAGENLAINFFDSEDVIRAWMNSERHKENILNRNFTEIGIGIARGAYDGKEAIFVVQLFGRPALAKAPDIMVIKNAPAMEAAVSSVVAAAQVKGADSPSVDNQAAESPSLIEKIIASPRAATNYFYLTLGTLIILALLLKVFIKIKIQHPRLIINGILLLLIISSVVAFNYYLVLTNAAIL